MPRGNRSPRVSARTPRLATIRCAEPAISPTRRAGLDPAGLKSLGSVRSQLSILKQNLGHLQLLALEEPDEINRFKAESDWAEDVELASVHRVLERLRAAINWVLAQTPPLFARSPFHRF